ncbi:hypothetical protein WJ96_04820 [Burkholderia ubonensis]|uniref:Uncharacterized protein n=1 Tax=Burkholderia ubonensis TaxID=101571 RepID=A0AAW3MXG0_9BURK|nr:hypothetical protein [Burkholderia ubonensis]KVP75091.1 hypothetical protein WJ93_06660 [Burkholderia ubonensis]KVP97896.1 hypothetical protein WJ96_04820 [Burkholderia ubonensis]KVZ92593.1 hypothetical protein WL25_16475 [Burkholderia ubonensis]
MRHKEGLPVSLLEEGMLDSSGILKSNGDCTSAYGLTDESVRLFLLIAAGGETGLAQSRIPKELRAELNAHLLPLEMQSLVAWERDNRGRLAYLVLTWKGEEAINAARTPATKQASWASRRKAAVGA